MAKGEELIGDTDIEDLQFKQNKSTVSFHKTLEEFLNNKSTSNTMDALNLIFTTTNSCIYVYRTYDMCQFDSNPIWQLNYIEGSDDFQNYCQEGPWHTYYYSLLIFSHAYFLIEFILRALVQETKFLISPESLLEIMTTVPFLICLSFGKDSYAFQFFVMLSQCRLFLFGRFTRVIDSELDREVVSIVIKIIFINWVMAAFTQFLESDYQYKLGSLNPGNPQNKFFYYYFFTMTTISTVGYGSHVQSAPGRITLLIFIAVVVFQIPDQSARLVQLINSKSVYASKTYKPIKGVPHIVLIGTVSQSSLINFLEEYFHKDHGEQNRHCVLMRPNRPDPNTEMVLMKPKYSNNLHYIEGSSLDAGDLKRCLVHKAKAVIILSDKFSFDAEHEDTHTILEAMVIKNYLNQINQQNKKSTEQTMTSVCMQLLRPESITHYELSLSKDESTKYDQIVCIESMKLSLLAKSCLCPGLIVLITNLIKSSMDPDEDLEEKKDDPNFKWLYNYWLGKQYEIYKVRIPDSYADQKFCDIASNIYKDNGLLLFALEIIVNDRQNGDILLNPGSYKLPRPFSKNNSYKYYGYIIADDESSALKVFEKDLENDEGQNSKEFQSFDSNDRAIIGDDFHQFECEDEDFNIEVDNMEGDLMNMCQTASKPVNKEDIIYETMEDSKLAENHIIICGMVENIIYFVMPLRASHCKDPSPIVILHDELPSAKQWQQLCNFSQIYFVQGSPLQEKSYDRVNIMKAKQIVILTPNVGLEKKERPSSSESTGDETREDEKQSKDQEDLLDAKTIFKYNIIKKKNPNVNVVTELINQYNIAFLLDNPLLYHFMSFYGYDQTPVFAAGEVYLSSLMDSLICQAYYNSALIIVLKQLIIGESKKNSNAGSKRIRIQDTDFSHVSTSNLYHIKVPKQFHGKRYSKLFDSLTTRRFMIPLGLYRTVKVNLKAYKDQSPLRLRKNNEIEMSSDPHEGTIKKIKYVVTNPDKDTRIEEDDLVFVLALQEPGDPETWDDYNNQNQNDDFGPKSNLLEGFDPLVPFSNQTKKKKQPESNIAMMARKGGVSQKLENQNNKDYYYFTMTNTANNQMQIDDGELNDLKPDIHQSLGSKKIQEEFDKALSDLFQRIPSLTDKVIELNKTVNQRNNSIVQDVSSIIHEVLHDANEATQEVSQLKKELEASGLFKKTDL